ncbi:hypothetical protein Bca4012_051110 [Brassica carinata]
MCVTGNARVLSDSAHVELDSTFNLLDDIFPDISANMNEEHEEGSSGQPIDTDRPSASSGNSKKREGFDEMFADYNQELYPGCDKFTKLSFILKLYHIKCMCGISDKEISMVLDLMKEAFSHAKLPDSFNDMKKVIRKLGMTYESIHACPNDCMLYWEADAERGVCKVCEASRWKDTKSTEVSGSGKKKKRSPAKVLRYFLLKPQLQRLFMSSKTTAHMRWNGSATNNDATYQRSDEELWSDGIETLDASTKQTFDMRAAIMWTISNFPGLGNLSGWNTCTASACPTYHGFRQNRAHFDGKLETRSPPATLTGSTIIHQLEQFYVTLEWIKQKVQNNEIDGITDDLRCLAMGPSEKILKYTTYNVNGFKFRATEREANLKTQNSGVYMAAETMSYASSRDSNPRTGTVTYYGNLIENEVISRMRMVISPTEEEGDEPYILASQAKMVYYVKDPSEVEWNIAVHVQPRDVYDMGDSDDAEPLEDGSEPSISVSS